uniref:MgtE_N domain-containing protein n=1 Tax=Ascaris lumbricoides TaxID=6252 RepID=A0A0M3I594_ASCLU
MAAKNKRCGDGLLRDRCILSTSVTLCIGMKGNTLHFRTLPIEEVEKADLACLSHISCHFLCMIVQTLLLGALIAISLPLPLINQKMDSLSPLEPYTVEIDKRDAENAILLTPPDSIAYLMELPRTDRKNLQKEIVEELRAMLTPEE